MNRYIAFLACFFVAIVPSWADIAIPGVSKTSGLTEAEKKAMLDEHNYLRSQQAKGKIPGQPAAANMIRMEWKDSTAQHAQTWADNCNGPSHGNNREFKEGQNYAGNGARGQLLKGAINGWFYKEYSMYSYGQRSPGAAGHYTQIVWAKSHSLGCGANKCPGSMFARLICNYYIAGNMMGEPPFEKGAACTKCPAGYGFCKDALCTSSRVCKSSDSSCKCTVDAEKCAKKGTFDKETCTCKCKEGSGGLNCDGSPGSSGNGNRNGNPWGGGPRGRGNRNGNPWGGGPRRGGNRNWNRNPYGNRNRNWGQHRGGNQMWNRNPYSGFRGGNWFG